MEAVIIENLVEIVVTALVMLIGVLGTWLTAKIGKHEQLKSINLAQQEVLTMAAQTVEELQQTVVDGLKAGREDGKLTNTEIEALGVTLLENTMAKMSTPTISLLDAAGVDITALIRGAGESWVKKIKNQAAIGVPLDAIIEVETE